MKTSHTHPVRLDVLPPGLLGTKGRLGLTIAPGKRGKGLQGTWRRDLTMDLRRLRDVYGVHVVVNLMESHELEQLGIESYQQTARALGLELLELAIRDAGVPGYHNEHTRLVRQIVRRLGDGQNVAVHCRGGLGRSGLVAASVLVSQGVEPERAIQEVRIARPGAIENDAQESCVRNFINVCPFRPERDGKLQPLSEQRERLLLESRFTEGEMAAIRLGVCPQEMEEKWTVSMVDDVLRLHRSWTGFCVYEVRFARRGDVYMIVEAWVTRDREVYSGTDPDEDAEELLQIINGVVLS